jgi:cyclopropane fatty-acyl-phospholipid synthase-like methyltransferase
MNITLKTDYPIAYDSPDHMMPWGTKNDNSTNNLFIDELLEFFKINYDRDNIIFLDLGCSGGQLVIDFYNRGNIAVGLEGSDYSIKHKRANWPEYHNKMLFTCDVSKPYELFNKNNKILFNLITAWEVIEHIHPDNLKQFFKNIDDNLDENGIFVGSISTNMEIIEGHVLHQSVFSEKEWYNKIFPMVLEGTSLKLYSYPFTEVVRGDYGSFHVFLMKDSK